MHFILHKAAFPAHLSSHTAVHLPPFFLAGTTRFSTESGSGAGDACTLMAVNSRHSAKAATIKANVGRFMSIPIDAQGRTIRVRRNVPRPHAGSNGLRGAAITFGGSW
jgi:hypothetical protein